MLLPHLADRAVTRIRWPHGVERQAVLREERPGGTPVLGAHGRRAGARLAEGRETIDYSVIDGLADLIWLANLAALELHVPQWTVGRAGPRTRPAGHRPRPGAPAGAAPSAAEVALLVRDRLAERRAARRR